MPADVDLDEIDRQIEALRDRLETCRQAMVLSRAAIGIGALVLFLVVTVAWSYRTPIVVLGAMTALLGGTVWLGANRSSHADAEGKLSEAEAAKARLFDEVAARNGWTDVTPTIH